MVESDFFDPVAAELSSSMQGLLLSVIGFAMLAIQGILLLYLASRMMKQGKRVLAKNC